jgi:hypothetical protein
MQHEYHLLDKKELSPSAKAVDSTVEKWQSALRGSRQLLPAVCPQAWERPWVHRGVVEEAHQP